MFYYFGRKGRLASHYPPPMHGLVIEPFAGSMAYTLHHQPERAIGIEIEGAVARTWQRVASMTPEQLLAYPSPAIGDRTSDRWQMMAAGSHGTSKAESYLWTDRMNRDLAKQKRMAAKVQPYVSASVDYRHGDYRDAPDVEATWFIDPPYQHVRRGYTRDAIDYDELADWCMSRKGLVIVCEQSGADWLPFSPLAEIRGTTNRRSVEACYLRINRAAVAA